MVTQPESRQTLIGPDPHESEDLVHREWWHKFLPFDKLKGYCRSWKATHKSPVSSAEREEAELSTGEAPTQEKTESPTQMKEEEERIQAMNGTISLHKTSNNYSENAEIEELPSICDEDSSVCRSEKLDNSSSSSGSDDKQEVNNRKWMAPWYWQFLVLAHRNFKQTRRTLLLSWMLWIQVSSLE